MDKKKACYLNIHLNVYSHIYKVFTKYYTFRIYKKRKISILYGHSMHCIHFFRTIIGIKFKIQEEQIINFGFIRKESICFLLFFV